MLHVAARSSTRGATVDGVSAPVYPPLLDMPVRY